MTPKNDAQFVKKAVATPATDMIGPASAGPTARARLNSIPLSAEAAARSSFGTNSGRIARQAGASNASPAESANVSTKSIHGDITPAMVKMARINAAVDDIASGACWKGQQKIWQGSGSLRQRNVNRPGTE
jgi:hypothetical protein